MRVKITAEAWADIPDDANVTAFAMSLQDSPTLLDEYLHKDGCEVIVFSRPKRTIEEEAK